MPPGLKQVTKPLFDWLENRQGGDSIAGVFFGVGLLVLIFLLPGGFVDGMRRLRARVVRVVPNPSWLRDVHSRPIADAAAPGMDDLPPDAALGGALHSTT
jgi:hypothetical protein